MSGRALLCSMLVPLGVTLNIHHSYVKVEGGGAGAFECPQAIVALVEIHAFLSVDDVPNFRVERWRARACEFANKGANRTARSFNCSETEAPSRKLSIAIDHSNRDRERKASAVTFSGDDDARLGGATDAYVLTSPETLHCRLVRIYGTLTHLGTAPSTRVLTTPGNVTEHYLCGNSSKTSRRLYDRPLVIIGN